MSRYHKTTSQNQLQMVKLYITDNRCPVLELFSSGAKLLKFPDCQ